MNTEKSRQLIALVAGMVILAALGFSASAAVIIFALIHGS